MVFRCFQGTCRPIYRSIPQWRITRTYMVQMYEHMYTILIQTDSRLVEVLISWY